MLYRYRGGDANMRSVWICSRNDAIGNVAVLLAAAGVFGTGTGWPDIVVASIMAALGISGGCLHEWLKQDRIDRGEIVGTPTRESADLRAARKRIRELESELAIIRQASKFLAEDKPHPKGFTR